MGKIYKGVTDLTIIVDLGVDITGATVSLRYEKPNEETGEVTDVNITDTNTTDENDTNSS